jgi:hypothetical protein
VCRSPDRGGFRRPPLRGRRLGLAGTVLAFDPLVDLRHGWPLRAVAANGRDAHYLDEVEVIDAVVRDLATLYAGDIRPGDSASGGLCVEFGLPRT